MDSLPSAFTAFVSPIRQAFGVSITVVTVSVTLTCLPPIGALHLRRLPIIMADGPSDAGHLLLLRCSISASPHPQRSGPSTCSAPLSVFRWAGVWASAASLSRWIPSNPARTRFVSACSIGAIPSAFGVPGLALYSLYPSIVGAACSCGRDPGGADHPLHLPLRAGLSQHFRISQTGQYAI